MPVEVPTSVGAYYGPFGQNDKPFESIDVSAIAGASFFLNSSLYIGLRANFGLTDVSINEQDFSRVALDAAQDFQPLNDADRNFILQASVGFSL